MELRKLNVCANKTRSWKRAKLCTRRLYSARGNFREFIMQIERGGLQVANILKWMSIWRDARIFDNLSPRSGSFSTGRSTTQHSPLSLSNSDLLVFPEESLILTKDDPKVIRRRSPLKMENGWVGSAPLPRRIRKYFRFLSGRKKCLNNNILALDWHWELESLILNFMIVYSWVLK